MSLPANFLDIIAGFSRAKSIPELGRLFKLYMAAQGITGYTFTYFGYRGKKGESFSHELVSERLRAWHDYYHESRYGDTDSVHQDAHKSLLPIFWDVQVQFKNAATEKERKMRQESLDFGVRQGVSIPVHGPGGDFAELTLRQFKGESCMSGWEAKQHEWYLVALAYFNYMRELILITEVSKSGLLTRREQQCLKLIAENYNVMQMAAALDMSERTVNFHIQNLNHKLKVRNKYEAVSVGRQLGLIT